MPKPTLPKNECGKPLPAQRAVEEIPAGVADAFARTRGMDVFPAAGRGADAHVIAAIQHVARKGLGKRQDLMRRAVLGARGTPDVDADLRIAVARQAGAVETGRRGAAPHVRHADEARRDVDDFGVGRPAARRVRVRRRRLAGRRVVGVVVRVVG